MTDYYLSTDWSDVFTLDFSVGEHVHNKFANDNIITQHSNFNIFYEQTCQEQIEQDS